jgi:hypothetical protein
LQVHSLLSGGVNKDDTLGDDAFVAHLAPVDDDGEVVKYPGKINLTLLDPALPEHERQIGAWEFSSDECRSRWTRGFSGAGYQFTLPLDVPVRHESVVLHAKMTTRDGRQFDANQICRVTPSHDIGLHRPALLDKPAPLDDIDDPPPPAGDSQLRRDSPEVEADSSNTVPPVPPSEPDVVKQRGPKLENDLPDWARQDAKSGSSPTSPPRSRPLRAEALRDSTNWTDATIPQLR